MDFVPKGFWTVQLFERNHTLRVFIPHGKPIDSWKGSENIFLHSENQVNLLENG